MLARIVLSLVLAGQALSISSCTSDALTQQQRELESLTERVAAILGPASRGGFDSSTVSWQAYSSAECRAFGAASDRSPVDDCLPIVTESRIRLLESSLSNPSLGGGGDANGSESLCDEALTTLDMRRCIDGEIDEVEDRLSTLRATLTTRSSVASSERIVIADSLWLEQAESFCVAISDVDQGTMGPLSYQLCFLQHLKAREKVLVKLYSL